VTSPLATSKAKSQQTINRAWKKEAISDFIKWQIHYLTELSKAGLNKIDKRKLETAIQSYKDLWKPVLEFRPPILPPTAYRVYRKAWCELCGEEGKVVHHINGNHEDNVIENLQTLCGSCYNNLHKQHLGHTKEKMHHYDKNADLIK
jgi:hypothetical protein